MVILNHTNNIAETNQQSRQSLTVIVKQCCDIFKAEFERKLTDTDEKEKAKRRIKEKLKEHMQKYGIPDESELESLVNRYHPEGLEERNKYIFDKTIRAIIKAELRNYKEEVKRQAFPHYNTKQFISPMQNNS